MSKPILCIDFDGVIHAYSRGWQDGSIYDGLVPGFVPWAINANKYFSLHIYSSRSKSPDGPRQMREWMQSRLCEQLMPSEVEIFIDMFTFCHEKPAAFLTIDDRAIQFRGDWTAWWLQPAELINFKAWTQGKPSCDAAAIPPWQYATKDADGYYTFRLEKDQTIKLGGLPYEYLGDGVVRGKTPPHLAMTPEA